MALDYRHPDRWRQLLLPFLILLTLAVYWPGLYGGYTFDDYPNIVNNSALRPEHITARSLLTAALSSPSSTFKRPLASLSFTANWLLTGMNPFWMKLTNVLIHLGNGLLLYWLSRRLLRIVWRHTPDPNREKLTAALIAGGWLLLPINLTAVLYVVQRMASMANLFVLAGLLGYVAARQRMQAGRGGGLAAWLSLILATAVGFTAKETAAMTPFYALLIEWVLFHGKNRTGRPERSILLLFAVVLVLPMVIGLSWLLPGILNPAAWATRDFTLGQRLLTEPRIILDYLYWIVLPTPHALSFYHDDIRISTGLLSPWTTLASILAIVSLIATAIGLRRRAPLIALGILLFFAGQLMTGTILPLELVFEQRSYFASFGVLLVLVPLLTSRTAMPLVRGTLLAALLALWGSMTLMTAWAWGNPLRLAIDLAYRAPHSPRAQYSLGRTYIILSAYNPKSPNIKRVYAPLERAMKLPQSSILPEQALIFFNARMHRPLKPIWWTSMIAKLQVRAPGVQDLSSLAALTTCAKQHLCDLPQAKMITAFDAALNHQPRSGRALEIYGDYSLNILDDEPKALRLFRAAVTAAPNQPVYRVTLIRLLAVTGNLAAARAELAQITPGARLALSSSTLRQLQSCLAPGQNGQGCANAK